MPFVKGHLAWNKGKRTPIVDACHVCGKTVNKKGRKYCSKKCYGIDSIPKPNRICLVCNKPFYRASSRIARGSDKYCSFKCSGIGRRNKRKEICAYCHKEFLAYPSQLEKYLAHYCSRKCFIDSRRRGDFDMSPYGYPMVRNDSHHRSRGGFVLEHFLVAEEKIGRKLLPGEIVHHINGVRTDNGPENLFVFGSQSEHMKFHLNRWRNGE